MTRRIYTAWYMPPRDPVTFSSRSHPIGIYRTQSEAHKVASEAMLKGPADGTIYGYDSQIIRRKPQCVKTQKKPPSPCSRP
jgi:hypothetical protein